MSTRCKRIDSLNASHGLYGQYMEQIVTPLRTLITVDCPDLNVPPQTGSV